MEKIFSPGTVTGIAAARAGGESMRALVTGWGGDIETPVRLSGDIMQAVIRERFPGDKISLAGETCAGDGDEHGVCWMVEPAEGRTNLHRRFPMSAVTIARVSGERVLAGIVYDYLRKEMFVAERGKGAYLNGKSIHVSTNRDIKNCLLTTGHYFYDYPLLQSYFSLLQKVLPFIHGLRRYGSSSLGLCWIACGRLDGFLDPLLPAHEFAAAALIVEEAGGSVTDWQGREYGLRPRHIAASNGHIHNWILNQTIDIMAGKG